MGNPNGKTTSSNSGKGNSENGINFEKPLAEIYDQISESLDGKEFEVSQDIEVSVLGTTVNVEFVRDFEGNVIEMNKFYENLPYLEDGQMRYDDELSLINAILDNPDNWYDLDQLAFEYGTGETFEFTGETGLEEYEKDSFNIPVEDNYDVKIKVGGQELSRVYED